MLPFITTIKFIRLQSSKLSKIPSKQPEMSEYWINFPSKQNMYIFNRDYRSHQQNKTIGVGTNYTHSFIDSKFIIRAEETKFFGQLKHNHNPKADKFFWRNND